MRTRIQIFMLAVCAVLAMVPAAQAGDPTFVELLARAKAQAAVGHRSTPPGDNMIETIAEMVDLASTATPAQLEELVALLESDRITLSEPKIVPPPLLMQPAPPVPSDAAVASAPPPVTQPEPLALSDAAATSMPPPVAQPAPSATSDAAVASVPPPVAQPEPSATSDAAVASTSPPMAQPEPPSASDAAVASAPPPVTQPTPSAPSNAAVASAPSPMNTSSTASLPAMLANPPSGAATAALPAQISPQPKPTDNVIARAAALFNRGQAAEAKGDFSGARRLYGSAAERGNAAAARSLGRLYDPAYLRLNTMGGVDPDPVLARSWYERAMKMGDPTAGSLLNALSMR